MSVKYSAELKKHFSAFPVFTMRDVLLFFSKQGLGRNYAHLMLHKMVEGGGLVRVSKGAYSFHNEILVAGFAFPPFYYGLQEALSLRGLWEQETNPVVITPRRVRSGVRKFGGNNFVVKRISRKMFFGFEPFKYYEFWIPVSTPEKTLVDFVYFRQTLDGRTLRELKSKIDAKKLRAVLEKCPKWVRRRVRNLS